MRRFPVLLIAMLLAPMGQAQFFDPLPYEDSAEFAGGFDGVPSLVSGQTTYNATDARNATVFMGTDGVRISDLGGVYWWDSNDEFRFETEGDLAIEVSDAGSFAFRTPGSYDAAMDAPYALTFFLDAGQLFSDGENGASSGDEAERNDILEGTLGPSLVTIPIDETIQIDDVETIPAPTINRPRDIDTIQDKVALVVGFSNDTTLTILDGDEELDALSGMGSWVGMHGTPVFSPINAELAIVPMPSGATAAFSPAEDEDVQRGLDGEHLTSAFASLAGGGGEGGTEGGAEANEFFEGLSGLAPFLNGAYVDLGIDLPGDDGSVEGAEEPGVGSLFGSASLVRFEELEATRSEGQLSYEGAAPLQVTDGEVAGARPLVGGVIPALSLVLWAIAIGATVAMIVLRPSKKSEFWDGFHLIGRIAGPVASILVFFIWDAAIADLFGASIVQGGLDGAGKAAIAAVELIPLFLAALFFGVPTRLIFRAGTRFAGQGRMMNIGNTIAPFVTLIFGLPLLLSLVDSALALIG